MDPRRKAVARFAEACATDPLVAAAFLGGSLAAGTADELSDLDLYVVTESDDYDSFFARREEFVRTWAEPVFLATSENFEGFGFDMLHFVLAEGVCGELALGHRGNMLVLHGGPYEVLVDKASLLDGVAFALYEPTVAERRREIERALHWFWLDAIDLAKRLARGQLQAAQQALAGMRERCELLAAVAGDTGVDAGLMNQRLLATFVTADADAIAAAAAELVAVHREVGVAAAEPLGLAYPAELAAVVKNKLRP